MVLVRVSCQARPALPVGEVAIARVLAGAPEATEASDALKPLLLVPLGNPLTALKFTAETWVIEATLGLPVAGMLVFQS